MTDTEQNNRPNVGENIRYLGHLTEELLKSANDTATNKQTDTIQSNTTASPSITVSGNHNIISTNDAKIIVLKESSKKLWTLTGLFLLFF